MTGSRTLADALAPAYRVGPSIGRGSAATVYRAHDARHDRDVALKVLDRDVAAEVGTERFLREMRIVARLAHPHVLPLYDSGDVHGWLYYVMPYVPGGSLRARLDREGALPIVDAVRIARQAAAALDFAHRGDVVHRDVKPDNLLLHDGEVLVADFGIARALGPSDAHITRAGVALGTPAYISPEQAIGAEDVDGRSDVYGLACVLYEMIAGRPPFTGSSAHAVIMQRLHALPEPIRFARPEAPAWLESVIARALETDPVDRYPTAAAFAAALLAGDDARPAIVWTGATPPLAPPSPPPNAVAVLPFVDLGAAGDDAYFGDGMAEEVINALAHVPGLHVASRTSAFAFRGGARDVREIGRRLGVAAVLEGTVRRADSRLRVTAQLSDTATGYQRWADRYDRTVDDVFAIQDELARTIVDALAPSLAVGATATRLARRYTDNLAAYDLYLRGRQQLSHFTADGLDSAIALFERAIAEAPGLAPAHAALGNACIAYAFYGAGAWTPRTLWARARRAATAALAIDDALADAVAALGTTSWACDWDFVAAERAIGRAVELKPGDALLHNWHGWALLLLGRGDECLLALERARDLDPLSPFIQRSVCRALYFERDHARAIAACRRLLAAAPDYVLAHVDLASALLAVGRTAHAAEALADARRAHPDDTRLLALAGHAAARLGDADAARRALAELEAQARVRYVTDVDPAIVLVALGDEGAALARLERARDARDPWVPWLHCWPLFDPLREETRFTRLLAPVSAAVR